MGEAEEKNRPEMDDAELERKIRGDRKFSLEEAIGRMAGGDLMKGASPVTRKRQAELAIKLYLEQHLTDAEGVLLPVMLRRIRESETLLKSGYDEPLKAFARFCERLLGSEELLRRFVQDVDAEWGRIYAELPHLEQVGRPPDEDDPYTFASVRGKLSRLIETLRGSDPGK